jgi:hypothetical protein
VLRPSVQVETVLYRALSYALPRSMLSGGGMLQEMVDVLEGSSLSLDTTLHLYLTCQTVLAYHSWLNLWLNGVEDGRRMHEKVVLTLERLLKEREEAEASQVA